jgi:hypothetical protein
MSFSSNFPAISPSLSLDFANTERLDPRVTFTRTTTAGYYDGVTVAKAEENLLLRSQEFNVSPWVAFEASVTANFATAPDNTNTAQKVIWNNGSTTSANVGQFVIGLPSTVYTGSMFVKAAELTTCRVSVINRTSAAAFIDIGTIEINLSNGTFTSSGAASGLVVGSAAVQDNWYRVFVTLTTPSNAGRVELRINTVSSGNGTSGIYIWGAQLEQRSAVTAYTPTTTQPITNYIPVLLTAQSGQPRFDHNPTTGVSLGLLVEEQRTNLLTYSDDFANAAWNKTRSTIVANTIVAPDGTLSGDKLIENTDNGTHFVTQNGGVKFSADPGGCLTIYAKAAERSWLCIESYSDFNFPKRAWFNLATGVIGTITGSRSYESTITAVGNGWYRCLLRAGSQGGGNSESFFVAYVSNADATISYQGDGYSGIYIWGAQMEAVGAPAAASAEFPTSYIPTVASTVTRNADAVSMTGDNFSNWYTPGQGTLYSEWLVGSAVTANSGVFGIKQSGVDTFAYIYLSSAGAPRFGVWNANSSQATLFFAPPNGVAKLAGGYKTNDFAASVNSGAVETDDSGVLTSFASINQAFIGFYSSNPTTLTGHIRKISFYPLRVSNTNLQALTT